MSQEAQKLAIVEIGGRWAVVCNVEFYDGDERIILGTGETRELAIENSFFQFFRKGEEFETITNHILRKIYIEDIIKDALINSTIKRCVSKTPRKTTIHPPKQRKSSDDLLKRF